jgi:hypothetical protein
VRPCNYLNRHQKGLTRINTRDDGASVDIIPFEIAVRVSDVHDNPHIIDYIQSVLVGFISGLQNSYEYKFVREILEVFEVSGFISSSSVIIRGYKGHLIRGLFVFADINFNSGMIRVGMTQPYMVSATTFMICQTDSILEKLESLVDGYINSPILRLIEDGGIDYCEQYSKVSADTIDRVRMNLSHNTNDAHIAKPHVNMSPNVLLISSLIDDECSIIDALYAMKSKIDHLISEVSYTK